MGNEEPSGQQAVEPVLSAAEGVHPEDIADWKKVMEEANAD